MFKTYDFHLVLQKDGFFPEKQLSNSAILYHISAKTELRFLSGSRRKIRNVEQDRVEK
jgi:hypothetical protein